jgi:Uncharacterized archaeal Zn-finger protein
MEIFENNFTVTFTNAAAANKAKQIADESFRALRYDFYNEQPSILAADTLTIEDDVTLTFDEGCFDSADLMDASRKVIKALAHDLKGEDFEFSACGSDTYTEAWVDGNLKNGVLDMTSTFFPEGYHEYMYCPECGEAVVLMEEYDPNATYVCPECGEEIDLSSAAPVIEKELIRVS